MASDVPRALQEVAFERAAQEYLRNLPLEHFMESTPQATQREVSLESLALVKAHRRNVHVFNELLVQYRVRGRRRLGQVVPDNMVVLSDEPITAESSFNVPLESAGPFWMLEYVSKSNPRKDYEESFRKYERELKVPYYLVFYPEAGELTLHHHTGRKYVTVKPNEHGRLAIPEVDLECALLDGWVRFWYKGELLPLPAELQRELQSTRARLANTTLLLDEEKQRADQEKQRADQEKQRAEQEKQRADELRLRLETVERELQALRSRPH